MIRVLRIALFVIMLCSCHRKHDQLTVWQAPDTTKIPATDEGRLIRYGRDLIVHTSRYLGPKGTAARISNGMNCQNCHLDAGTKLWGNNYSAVYSTYPKFRDRSGSIENIFRRVNDCICRSLNGQPLDTNSLEMKAIAAYMKWLGREVPTGIRPTGAGIADLPFLVRPADSGKGRIVYLTQCQRCHGPQGEGTRDADDAGYVYPPLWGEHSYTTAAGLYRISRLAGYAKDNMPFGCSHQTPLLSDEDAWDVAAFINSQPRPDITFTKDWPNISKKPFDHPFGPYADTFTSRQHKYGPFGPMIHHQ